MMKPRTLNTILESGSAAAIIYGERRLSSAELDLESRRIARGLSELGVHAGDRVGLWMPNTPEWLAALFACARLGAIGFAINTRFRASEVADVVHRAGIRTVLFWPSFRQTGFDKILADVPPEALTSLKHFVAYGEDGMPHAPRLLGRPVIPYSDLNDCSPLDGNHASPDAPCVIFTTSGTTRLPKFVVHSQETLATHSDDIAGAFGMKEPGAAVLLTIPLCGTFGLSHALGGLAGGGRVILTPAFDAHEAGKLIVRHGVTHIPAVTDVVARLLATSAAEKPFPSVRIIVGARTGQAAPADARGLRLIGVYGSSELQAMLSRQPSDASAEQRELGGGRLIAPEGRVRAAHPDTGEPLPHGTSGELQFRVPSRMPGYYGNPDATAEALTADGYFRSGDLGYTVDERTFVFQSRMGDAIRLGGFLVNPLEIESIIDRHPAVLASQVVGVEGDKGLMPVAFVIPRPGATLLAEDILAHCSRQMARYKVPAHVFEVNDFPVTPSANGNKVQKAKLREMALAALASKTTSS